MLFHAITELDMIIGEQSVEPFPQRGAWAVPLSPEHCYSDDLGGRESFRLHSRPRPQAIHTQQRY